MVENNKCIKNKHGSGMLNSSSTKFGMQKALYIFLTFLFVLVLKI